MPDIKRRIEWIDVAKGIGIILVIMGHTIALRYSKWIYSFHMPLFFFLSGLVYNSTKFTSYGSFFRSKIEQIILPWLIFFMLGCLFTLVIPPWRNQLTLNNFLLDLYTTNTNSIQNSSIWYLVCFFVMLNVFYFFNKIKRSKGMVVFFCCFAIALLWTKTGLSFLSNNVVSMPYARLPLKIDSALIALVFFSVAVWQKEKITRFFETDYSWKQIVFSGITLLILSMLNGWVNLNSLDFGNIPVLFYPIAFLGIACICAISQKICLQKNERTRRILSFYGQNSLLIFGLQSLLIRLYILAFNEIENRDMVLYANNPLQHQIASFLLITFIISPIIAWTISNFKKKVCWK